jgi:predicted alpha/beta-hydrolase family hydrolase
MTAESGLLVDGAADAPLTLILAHGAGGPMDSAFMTKFARAIAAEGFRVVRFEFPYMAARRRGEKRGIPDREPVLRASWLEVIARLGDPARLVIGGKSMGGRIASMVADEAKVASLVCLGYPFHPPGKPEKLRTAHLGELKTPTLIVQGTRDPFGTREEIAEYTLSPAIRIHYIEGGEHSWKPLARSGRTEAENVREGIGATREFLRERSR